MPSSHAWPKRKTEYDMYIKNSSQFASAFTGDFVQHLVTRGRSYNI